MQLLVGYLLEKVALLILHAPVRVLVSGEVVVNVEFFLFRRYSCNFEEHFIICTAWPGYEASSDINADVLQYRYNH